MLLLPFSGLCSQKMTSSIANASMGFSSLKISDICRYALCNMQKRIKESFFFCLILANFDRLLVCDYLIGLYYYHNQAWF